MFATESSTPMGADRTERFEAEGVTFELTLPPSAEALIDEAEFDADERLPYWAELWPSARALAHEILKLDCVPDRAIELGCGVGLPSLALLHRGVEVLATDYYEEALLRTQHNATRNQLNGLATRHLDWRHPPLDLPSFPLAVASDVLYEQRNAEALVALLPHILGEGGTLLLADPGRVYLHGFLDGIAARGGSVHTLPPHLETAPAGDGRLIDIQRFRITLPRGRSLSVAPAW